MKRIMVIDDNLEILSVVKAILEMHGYEVITSGKGEEAKNEVVKHSPQLILLDVYLKGSNGVEICNQLKSDKLTRHIPVIMFSAQTTDYLVLRKCAADDFIEKPFDNNVLVKKVDHLLNTAKGNAEATA